MITTVSTADALIAALRSAQAGDTILLAAGTYNSVGLYSLNFSGTVTIASADPSHQAVFSNLDIGGCSNLAFNQLQFTTTTGTAATVSSSSKISFSGDTFFGATAGSGNAMMIRDSDTVTVTGSNFGKFNTGINELSDNNVTITNNVFHDITSGAIRGTGVTNETISGNTFTDANATVTDHSDVISLWQDNTANHVTITNNIYGSATSTTTTTASSTTTTTSDPVTTSSGSTGATVTVSNTKSLINAIKHAHAGDTILLNAGTYNGVALNNLNFSSAVTIKSADAAHQAVISNLNVSGSSNLAFNQLQFTTGTDTAATVSSSSKISFSGDTFFGATAGTGNAMMIRSSDTVTVTGSNFGKFNTGINELTDNNVSITKNVFHDITSGAIRGSGVTNEIISGNTFTDAKATVADHSDVISLWQDNTANHVTITNNIYGTGTSTTTTTPTTTTTTTTGSTTTGSTTTTTTGSTTTGSTTTTTTGSTTTGSTTTTTTGSITTGSTPTPTTTVTVSTTADLVSAVQHAHAGDTILVAAGTYNAVGLYNLNFSGAVTIQSADASHQAVFVNLDVSGSSNLAFNQLQFTTGTDTAASVTSSSKISFSGDTFFGATAGTGNAMMIRGSDTVAVTGSNFGKFNTGINELTDNNVTITNNVFHDITSGAIRGTGVTNETISGNTFSDANVTIADHSDVIALWQDNTANHVTITNNTFGSGSSATTSTTTTTTTTTAPTASTVTTGTSTSGPTTVTVGSVSELQSALKSAHAGDTILLKAGVYDGVGLYNLKFSGAVTIASADTTHEAVINNLEIDGSSNLALKNLDVQLTGTAGNAIWVGNSSHISLDGMTVHGSATDLQGTGVFIRNSNDVTLSNSEITHLISGIGHLDDSGLVISNNRFHDLGTDGVFGASSSHVIVANNTFTDFTPGDGVHPDAIQFFAADGVQSSDIMVSGNVITRGSGAVIQGIFVENTNHITITDNAMLGTMYNGISLSATSTGLIEDNYVQGYSDMNTWIIVRGGSADVTVAGNTTQSIINYVDSGVVNPNFLSVGNTIIGAAPVGDLTALNTWLSQHTGVTTTLTGGLGGDTLSGTAGADTMSGGVGNDVYLVNNAGDIVNETAYAGVDTVKSGVLSYALGDNVEKMVLTGTTAQTGVGNSLDNVMIGNGVQSSLNGMAGNDTLVSMGGATTLTGGAGSDVFSIGAVPTTPVQITDFTVGQDKLDLHTLLANYHGSNPVGENWVQFQSDSSGLTVLVDVDGPYGATGYVAVAKLAGITSLSTSDWLFH